MNMSLQENLVVADRFRLVRMIGRGGMGSVWQAVNISLDQPCAVKFIEGEVANLTDAHARFEREAKAAAQLRSPHVVQILDHGVWQGRPYIAMELLDGEDLGKTLARAGGKLPPAQVYTIIEQVCRALTKAHQAGIVHRDLKPDNIFLVNDDDRQLVKILDFGVAKQTSHAIDGSNTKTGAMLGTPYYMSPEQAQGIKSVDSRSDLWSLAVIVYQCLTGRLPFESEALGDLLVKIIVNPIPVPSKVAHVPPGFDAWWARAAERNPDSRFATAKDFAAALAIAVGQTSTTDPHTRSPLQGTAMMAGAGSPPFQQTPAPFIPAQTAALQATPHPANPPSGISHPHLAAAPGMANPNMASTPATFSGVEPPIAIPKKGPPLVLLAGLGGLLVLGIVGVGLIATHKSSSSGGGVSSATVSSTPVPPPPSIVTSEPAPSTSQPASTTEPSKPEPSATVATTPPTTPTATAKVGGGKVQPPTTPSSAPSTTTTATAAPSASTKKWTPGF